MSSKYNPRVTPRKTPPWCKAGMYPVTPPVVDGRPTYITTYLAWKDFQPAHQCDVTASLDLLWSASESAWLGHQTGSEFCVGGKIVEEAGENLFTLAVELWHNGLLDEWHDFEHVQMGPDFPWDSGLLELVTDPTTDRQAIHAMA